MLWFLGIANTLEARVTAIAKALGYKELFLSAHDDIAIGMYSRRGFKQMTIFYFFPLYFFFLLTIFALFRMEALQCE